MSNRNYLKNQFAIFFIVLAAYSSTAQKVDKAILEKTWKASWISMPGESPTEYGVYIFRKSFDLPAKPSSFIVHASADNRYKLFVNERLVSLGPARGEFYYWNFETIDIAPYLQQGTNTIAALVWNEGEFRPEAQITFQTAFILYGNSVNEEVINTDKSWKCFRDQSYEPIPVHLNTYYVSGPGEHIDMNKHISGWEKTGYDDSNWKNAQVFSPGTPKGVFNFSYGWMLVPSSIPPMELTIQRLSKVRKAEGVKLPSSFPASQSPFTVAANTKASILLDQSVLTNAYLHLLFEKGKDATLTIGYAEALYNGKEKGNRDEIEGKEFKGRQDKIISNGNANQSFTTLWWRTYRYILLTVETKGDPIVIHDIYGTFTGYPFTYNAKFETANPALGKMLDIGWRTARLCAVETYMDCPYYEQLQYIGDTRIQALVSFYNSGDDRLVKNAINLMDHSRLAEGVTQSRHPSFTPQIIPTFSLWWIGMLHDYWMYREDSDFIKEKLPGQRQVLAFFQSFQDNDGSLKNVPYWIFTDWATGKGWDSGVAPLGSNGNSAILDLHLLWTYELAAQLENNMGMKEYSDDYKAHANQLRATIQNKYWVESKKMYADRPEKDVFSQHANALAILTGMVKDDEATALGRTLLTDTTLVEASIYFKYYLHQALVKAGLGNDYLNWLSIWHENIKLGLTTWAEISDVSGTRSDCHAWGSSPNIEFFRTVLGIDSGAPGFARIKIEPHLGTLTKVSGEIPHPQGKIAVSYANVKGKWTVVVSLPESTSGDFIWKGKQYPLKGGLNNLQL